MKILLATAAAISALALASPAMAQYGNPVRDDTGLYLGVDSRIAQLEARIEAGVRAGTISRQEAFSLRQRARELRRLERQYNINGLTGRERADLQQRLRLLRQQIRLADGGMGRGDRCDDDIRYGDRVDRNRDGWDDRDYNRDGRWDNDIGTQGRVDYDRDGWDDRDEDCDGRWDDRDDDDGRYGDRVDNNRDGWDDRDRDRDGRWDDDVNERVDTNRDGWDDRDYDRDGRWDDDIGEGRYPQGDNRNVVERVIDSVTGGGALRVGQRASGNLGAVPYEYRTRYRDGGGVYYRSDGRNIYQIDARTDVVLRIYAR